MTEANCREVRDLAAEVALGIATGEERARVLQHIAGCTGCRQEIAELAQVADSLLLLAPEEEPPSGFESRVFRSIDQPRRSFRRRVLLGSAAACIALVVGGGGVLLALGEDRQLAEHYRNALAGANGDYFGVVDLRDEGGEETGHVFVYEGDPSWVFVNFSEVEMPGEYGMQVVTPEGERLEVASFDVTAKDKSWGGELPVDLDEVATIRCVLRGGAAVMVARLPSGG
jgi:putative zinc finger protein